MMALLDVVGKLEYLQKSPMKSLIINLVDNAGHACAVIFVPFVVLLKIPQEGVLCLVEVAVVAAHLCLLKTLHELLFHIWSLLLGTDCHACEQQSDGNDGLLIIHLSSD